MANDKPKTKKPAAKKPTTGTKKSYVTTTSTGNPLYSMGATGRDVDTVGKYLVDNGYMGSYSGKYDSNMQNALQSAKKDLLGGSSYKGATFGAATLDAIAKKNAEATAAAKEAAYNNGINEGYNSAMGEVEGIVQSALVPYQQMFSNMQTQQNAALQNAQKLSADQINNAYNLSARDYYQLYKTQQAKLPENLSKAGVTGGASESAQLNLMNNYSENLYKNEAARNNQLAGINQNYNDQIAQNSINAANQMANAYLQMAQQQLAYKRQDELAQKEQQAQAEQNAIAQSIAQWNSNVEKRMQEQLAKGDTIWTWTDDDGKKHWTTYEAVGLSKGGKKLSPSSSKVKSSGGSSTYSGGSSGSGGSGGSGGSTPSSATSYSYDTLKYNMTNALLKGATKSQLQTFVNPIEASYKSGKITEKQARELLKMLGA